MNSTAHDVLQKKKLKKKNNAVALRTFGHTCFYVDDNLKVISLMFS